MLLLSHSKYKRADAQFYKRQSLVLLLPIHFTSKILLPSLQMQVTSVDAVKNSY